MEQQRNLLFILFLILSLFVYWAWESDQLEQIRMAEQAAMQQELIERGIIDAHSITGKTVRLASDTLELAISLTGGDIVDARLPQIRQEIDKDDPFHLLQERHDFVYVAQSGLAGRDGPDSRGRPQYSSSAEEFTLGEGEEQVSAVLTYSGNGLTLRKIYTLSRGSYVVGLRYEIENSSGEAKSMAFYGQLKQTIDSSHADLGAFGMVAGAYRGTAYSTDELRYEKNTLDDLGEYAQSRMNLSLTTTSGWVAMIQHYFVTAWIVDGTEHEQGGHVIYSNASSNGRDAIIGARTTVRSIEPGQSQVFEYRLWVGPKNQDQMALLAPNLDLTVDYGWLWFISIPLFRMLAFIHGFVGNWGFAIIILTLIVRGVLFPLTKAQYTSMAKMRLLTPKMQELRDRYKGDRQKLSQETMRLYKSEKVNPLGGCLPLLIQMPIFIALYWTLMESTELRHAPFILWINDLSVYDPWFVTPILYGITMYIIQKMSPTPVTDPLQRKIFMAMPLVFTFMFCTFPAGLTIYWLVSNIFTIFQQIIIFKSLEKRGLHVREAKKD